MERYSLKCDVFSFAMVAHEIFEGALRSRPEDLARAAAGPEAKRPDNDYLDRRVQAVHICRRL